MTTDETDYSALFETSRFGSSFESDDEDKFLDRNRSKSSPTHLAQAGSPVHFGLAQVCSYNLVLQDYVSKVVTPGLGPTSCWWSCSLWFDTTPQYQYYRIVVVRW